MPPAKKATKRRAAKKAPAKRKAAKKAPAKRKTTRSGSRPRRRRPRERRRPSARLRRRPRRKAASQGARQPRRLRRPRSVARRRRRRLRRPRSVRKAAKKAPAEACDPSHDPQAHREEELAPDWVQVRLNARGLRPGHSSCLRPSRLCASVCVIAYRSSMRAKASAARNPARRPAVRASAPMPSANAAVAPTRSVVDRHRRSPLTAMLEQRRRPCGRRSRRSVRHGRRGRARSTTACPAGAERAVVRGRSAGRARQRCLRRRGAPPAGGRDGCGTAATGRVPSTTSGRLARITPHTSARVARSLTSSPSTWRRKTTSIAPSTAAALRCSCSRVATSAARSAAASQVPLEPSVQMHNVHRARRPPPTWRAWRRSRTRCRRGGRRSRGRAPAPAG